MTRLVAIAVLAAGCARERDPAPPDLDELLHRTYRHFEEPEALADTVDQLAAWLGTGVDGTVDGFLVDPLRVPDVAGLDRPDRPIADAIGVGAGWVSPYGILDHAALVVLADQTYLDPPAYDRAERTVADGDVDAFLAGRGTLRTVNQMEKGKLGVIIPYTLYKDFTWVNLGDGRLVLASRSWSEESGCNPSGSNCLWQTYSVDLWYAPDAAADETLRVQPVWNELTTSADGLLSDDQKVAVAVDAIVAMFEGTDAALAGE